LAGERAARQFGLNIMAHAIQDEAINKTRFAIICLPQTLPTPPASGRDCTSLVVSVPNRPGAVHDLLVPLKNNGVSMTRFESRPAKSGQWEYFFYIDLQGHITDPNVKKALEELKGLCAYYKILGSYPVGE
jgi:chorismate mutase/prephenate dehydratase